MARKRLLFVSVLLGMMVALACIGCGDAGSSLTEHALTPAEWTRAYTLSADASGVIELYDHFYNLSVVSDDQNLYRAEYQAGYVQGRLSDTLIPAARENALEGGVREAGLPIDLINPLLKPLADLLLNANLNYTLNWIQHCGDASVKQRLIGLFYRMRGIAHGATGREPEHYRFDADEPFEPGFLPASELTLAYLQDKVTLLDVYFLNALDDLTDIGSQLVPVRNLSERCSAFIRRTDNDLILAHTTWTLYSLSLPVRFNLYLNGEYMSVQASDPGLLSSSTDFGYNGHGIIFDETTVTQQGRADCRVNALWTFWRAALAELYSRSLDEFFDYISLENSGTYMNGYQVGDSKAHSFGLVEMDEHTFYCFRPLAHGGHEVSCKPECGDLTYDETMVSDEYVIGFNYPAAHGVRQALNYPEAPVDIRYNQLISQIDGVRDIPSSKALITYHDDAYPRSIYARGDLVADGPTLVGSVDAKVVSATMLQQALEKAGRLEPALWWAASDGCWMKFGPPSVGGEPFVWSKSQWSDWRHDLIPDVMFGQWQMYFSHIQ